MALEIKKTEYLGLRLPYFPATLGVFIGIIYFWILWYPDLFQAVLLWLLIFLPFLAPPLLGAFWWVIWRTYVRAQYIAQQTPVLLEFKVPAQLLKTPKAMEEVFNNLHVGPGESTFIARWMTGKVRPWFSLEIASLEGDVRMYVWTWKQFRGLIESAFYAQYPDLEIHEVADYTSGIFHTKDETSVFGAEFALTKDDAYPIKTYVDLGLDQDAKKAEQIVDPISSVFEKLSAFGAGEQFWVQIIIRQNKGAKTRPIFWFEKPKAKSTAWKKDERKNLAQDEVDKMYEEAKPKKSESGEIENDGYPMLKPAQINAIKAIERSIEKPAFDTGIRVAYVAKADNFDGTKIAGFLSLFNAFNSGQLNSFKPGGPWNTALDYPWQDYGGHATHKNSKEVIDFYRRRSLFHAPCEREEEKRFVLTTEELATIYHFPSEETRAPGLRRLSSRKGEAPANLPM